MNGTIPWPHNSYDNFKLTCHTREQNSSGQKRHQTEQTREQNSSGQGWRERETSHFKALAPFTNSLSQRLHLVAIDFVTKLYRICSRTSLATTMTSFRFHGQSHPPSELGQTIKSSHNDTSILQYHYHLASYHSPWNVQKNREIS